MSGGARRTDAAQVVGLRAPGAPYIGVAVWVLYLVLGLTSHGVANDWLYAASFVLIAVGGVLVLLDDDDPVSTPSTAVIAAGLVGAQAFAVLSTHSDDRLANLMVSGGAAIVMTFLCLRGRVLWSWAAFAASLVVVAVLAGTESGAMYGQAGTIGILVMATVFTRIVRPRAARIAALREQAVRAAAQQRSDDAVREVRRQRLARLDERARPLLDRIVAGGELTADEIAECRLVEAQLRDRIRAAGFDSAEVEQAATRARERGVHVLLLDDYSRESTAPAPTALCRIRAALVEVLGDTGCGDEVVARILPHGREELAMITVVHDGGTDRRVFDARGQRRFAD
ncbi:MAG: hypothetical protein QM658_08250 [Gordonia sp. (in: high G+C Gram-positive bacteria)]